MQSSLINRKMIPIYLRKKDEKTIQSTRESPKKKPIQMDHTYTIAKCLSVKVETKILHFTLYIL